MMLNYKILRMLQWLLMGCLLPFLAWSKSSFQHFDPVSEIIFWVTSIYSISVVGQFFAKKMGQPSVLGELVMGIIVGNLGYYFRIPELLLLREGPGIFHILPDLLANHHLFRAIADNVQDFQDLNVIKASLLGPAGADLLNAAYVLDVFSRFGIIYLLFMVGLETSWVELKKVGAVAIRVAIVGVLAPMFLGFLFLYIFFENNLYQNLFIAATLTATSVGISARVLQDLKKIRSKEAQVILGAAMIDDILGLFVLAVVSSLVLHGQIGLWILMQIFLSTAIFFSMALFVIPRLIKGLVPYTNFLEIWEAKVVVAFICVMVLSWIASLMGLSTIVGAFTAGLILHDQLFEKSMIKIRDLMAPLQFLLAPLFFFLMGVQVKLNLFCKPSILWITVVLSGIAIIGKLISGFATGHRVNRWFIGLGMIPRGEVGLIFASLGKSIGVVNDDTFFAIVLMVVITTVIAPPLMKRCQL